LVLDTVIENMGLVGMSHAKYKTVSSLHEHITGSVERCPFVEKGDLDIDFA
jgi:hypothetical protein